MRIGLCHRDLEALKTLAFRESIFDVDWCNRYLVAAIIASFEQAKMPAIAIIDALIDR